MKADHDGGSPAEARPVEAASQFSGLLRRDAVLNAERQQPTGDELVDGIAVGLLSAIDHAGRPVVDIPSLRLKAVLASSMVPIVPSRLGQAVALGFELGRAGSPIVLGFMMSSPTPAPPLALEARVDGERVSITGANEVELRCGEAAIVLNADGRIELRGTYITSQASVTQRIRGGSVQIN